MRRARDGGMVSAELAMAIPVLVLVLGLCLGAVSVGVDQVRCIDAARVGARALARGDDPGTAQALSSRAAPAGASITASSGGQEVRVTVALQRSVLGWRTFALTATSVAARETP